MIKFREKNFALPLAAIGTAVMGGTSVLGVIQGNSANKKQEEFNQAQLEQQEEHNRHVQNTLNKIAQAAKEDPAKAGAALGAITQERLYSAGGFAKNIGNFAKDLGKVIFRPNRKAGMVTGIASGLAMGTGAYVADKFIQRDAKKIGLDYKAKPEQKEEQKTYSKFSVLSTLKKNKGSIALTAGLGTMLPLGGYLGERYQHKSQLKEQEEAAKSQQVSNSVMAKPQTIAQKQFTAGKIGFATRALDKVSKFVGGGGLTGVRNFGRTLEVAGKKSGSTMSQATGRFLRNNPKTSLALSVGAGLGMMSATWGTGEKIAKKAFKSIDKNAYDYMDSKEKKVEKGQVENGSI